MNNAYVDGLRQHDNRPRSPVIVPHNLSELRKKILFENTLLEERALHEFSAGKGDGAGVDTGSAPLKPLTSPTPTRTPTPTPTPTPAPAGIPVASTSQIIVSNYFNSYFNNTYNKIIGSSEIPFTDGDSNSLGTIEILNGSAYVYAFNKIILSPNATMRVATIGSHYSEFTYPSWAFGTLYIAGDGYDITFYQDNYPNPNFNPSTNQSLIPNNGWTPFPMTITAA